MMKTIKGITLCFCRANHSYNLYYLAVPSWRCDEQWGSNALCVAPFLCGRKFPLTLIIRRCAKMRKVNGLKC